MTRPDPEIAERQREALANLRASWSAHLDHDTSDGIKAAIGTFREQLEQTGIEASGAMLSEILDMAMRKAYAVDHPGQRYADYQASHPHVEWSDDLTYFKVESDLEKALGLHMGDLGKPGFDNIIRSWQALDVKRVTSNGMGFGLRKTLSLMVPIADARLALVTGDLEVEDILEAYPPDNDLENGFAA